MIKSYIAEKAFALRKLLNGDLILQLILLKIKVYLKKYSK